MKRLALRLLDKGLKRGMTVATAESCTGGMVAAAITDIAGSSAVFLGGFVTYSNAMKSAELGVSEAELAEYGAVSEPVARAMAEGARAATGADLAVAITGIAGPGGSELKPEGRVCFGISGAAGTHVETMDFGALGRAQVRRAARDHALRMLLGAMG